jgi:hypothetical protein
MLEKRLRGSQASSGGSGGERIPLPLRRTDSDGHGDGDGDGIGFFQR